MVPKKSKIISVKWKKFNLILDSMVVEEHHQFHLHFSNLYLTLLQYTWITYRKHVLNLHRLCLQSTSDSYNYLSYKSHCQLSMNLMVLKEKNDNQFNNFFFDIEQTKKRHDGTIWIYIYSTYASSFSMTDDRIFLFEYSLGNHHERM